ncbi:MAG TPA: CAP domain-containing protein [Azospirillaceae bacterium]|nr:CAP domain-containing protein [Azospirillaceae bacterium]
MPSTPPFRSATSRRRFLAGGACLLAGGLLPAGQAQVAAATPASSGAERPGAAGPAQYHAAFEAWVRAHGYDPLMPVEQHVLHATNAERAEERLLPLAPDEELRRIARFYAYRALGNFDHVDAEGRSAFRRVAILHRRHVGEVGENLFQTSIFDRMDKAENMHRHRDAAQFAVDCLMDSPGHRRNILHRRWTHAGMGVARAPEGFLLVQLFARRVALLADPLPVSAEAGTRVPAAAWRLAQGRVDLVSVAPPGEARRGAMADRHAARLPATPGPVQLRYAVEDGRSRSRIDYYLYDGPILELTPPAASPASSAS